VNAMEDRLRTELRAESELITRDGLKPLSLDPRDGSQPATAPRRATRGRSAPGWTRRWPAWVAPVAAAAAVAAVITGTLSISRLVAGGPGQQAATGVASYTSLPPYYATTVEGAIARNTHFSASVLGRQIQVRSTSTGKVLATLNPPGLYNDYAVLAGSEDGRTFVFGAERYFGFRDNNSNVAGMLDATAPVSFTIAHIGPGSQVTQSALTLPFVVPPDQQVSIALSPDGSRLAVAYGGAGDAAMLRIMTLATGKVSQWAWPHVLWTPLLRQQGAWTADGRTLVLQEAALERGPAPIDGAVTEYPRATTILMINAMAAGGTGDPAKRLVLQGPKDMSAPWQPFITPDGSELVATASKSGKPRGPWSGEFAVYSAQTGALTGTQAPWTWGTPGKQVGGPPPRQVVAWSSLPGSRLLVLQPQGGASRLGVLEGGTVRLTGSDLLPRSPAALTALESALRNADGIPGSMAW
jgi:hypothetical protein